jgi:hypothetical protein
MNNTPAPVPGMKPESNASIMQAAQVSSFCLHPNLAMKPLHHREPVESMHNTVSTPHNRPQVSAVHGRTLNPPPRPSLPSRWLQPAAALGMAILLLGAFGSFAADSNPPKKLTYQGFLTDVNGVPLGNTGPVTKTVIFRIYDALTGGTKLWTSVQIVTVDKGHFSVLLGEGTALTSESGLFNADLSGIFTSGSTVSDRFLELTVDSTVIAPRLQFLASPYSMLAGLARKADALTGSSVGITGANTLEFGVGVSGKEGNAGKIGYQTFTPGALDIVGAGTGANRKVQIYAESGLSVSGPLNVNGAVTATSFSGSGSGLTGLSASQITSGNLPDSRLSGNIVTRDGNQNLSGQKTFNGGLSSPKWRVTDVLAYGGNGLPRRGFYVPEGGTLVVTVSASGYASSANTGLHGVQLDIGPYSTANYYIFTLETTPYSNYGKLLHWYNQANTHGALPPRTFIIPAGTLSTGVNYAFRLSAVDSLITDINDFSQITITELPF